jgi:hypothetical protein
MFIPDPGSGFFPIWLPDQGVKKARDPDSRISNTDIFIMRRDEKRLGKVILKNPLSCSRLIGQNEQAHKYMPNKLQMRIGILILYDEDPDPDADPDFHLMRIRVTKMMRIQIRNTCGVQVQKKTVETLKVTGEAYLAMNWASGMRFSSVLSRLAGGPPCP